jgi:hypothetical protein
MAKEIKVGEPIDKKAAATKRAEQLSEKNGNLVHVMIFVGENEKGEKNEDDLIIGYLNEPPFLVKARAMDKSLVGMAFTASLEILDACLIKEESDPRLLNEKYGNGKYKLGAAEFCRTKILIATDQAEKKS